MNADCTDGRAADGARRSLENTETAKAPRQSAIVATPGNKNSSVVSVRRDRHAASMPEAVTNDSGFALNSPISPAVRTSPRLRWILAYLNRVGTSSADAAPQI